MKKHLIAAAVAAAVAVPAFAQNVELFGRIDTGYTNFDAKTTTTTDTSQISFSNFLTSRWGLRGTEDLGGGLKASFYVESQLAAARGATTTQEFGGRGLWLELSGSFGSIRAGRMDTASKGVYDAFEVGESNNVRGTLAALGGSSYITGQRDNAIRYTTPTFSGVNASLAVMQNKVETTGAADRKRDTGEEFGIAYAQGPLAVRAAYRSVKNVYPAGLQISSTLGGTALYDNSTLDPTDVATVLSATDAKLKTTGLGAGYDFGVARVTAQYWDVKTSPATGAETKDKSYIVGVRVPLGTVDLFASLTDGERKTTTTTDWEGYNLGAFYNFSKRTRAYLAYGNDKLKPPTGAQTKNTQTAVGVVHTF